MNFSKESDDLKFSKESLGEILDIPPFQSSPTSYILEPGLFNAVKVALMLKMPLLLTGNPGTGKTRLAAKLAADLSSEFKGQYLPFPLVFNTKTVSTFSDLFYLYDALGHFQAAHVSKDKESVESINFIQLQALGQAIFWSHQETITNPKYHSVALNNEQKKALNKLTEKEKPFGSVVLIDEIDKAPRDFVNDLLNELDKFEFSVKEDKNTTYSRGSCNIFVILTSNSEKNLPDAFLRRCIFYHIGEPSDKTLKKIVIKQLFEEVTDDKILEALYSYMIKFNDIKNAPLKKQPSTAELVNWLRYLKPQILNKVECDSLSFDKYNESLSILLKNKEDLKNHLRN